MRLPYTGSWSFVSRITSMIPTLGEYTIFSSGAWFGRRLWCSIRPACPWASQGICTLFDRQITCRDSTTDSGDRTFYRDRSPLCNWMVRLSSGTSADMLEDLWLAAALASNAVSKGHICASLSDWAGRLVEGCDRSGTQGKRYPDLSQWVDKLKITPVVGAADEFKPLILDEKHRLTCSVTGRMRRSLLVCSSQKREARRGRRRAAPERWPSKAFSAG